MSASAGGSGDAAGCEGCAGCAAVIAGLRAYRDAAVRRAEEAEAGAAAERKRREDAEARLQAVDDRLEFVWPMYSAVRSRYEDLYAAHLDLRRKHRDLESEYASLDKMFGVVKRQAARAVGLESENAALREHGAKRDDQIGRLISMLRCGRGGGGMIVYPEGPNTPPSEARAAAAAAGGGGEEEGGEDAARAGREQQQQQQPRRRGAAKRRRRIPGKPGGRRGHRGHGASYDKDAETVIHKFARRADGSLDLPGCPCGCGEGWVHTGWTTRMIRDVKVVFFDARHTSERAECLGCGAEAHASDGAVLRQGACGATLATFIVMLHDNNVKYHVIAEILDELKGGKVMSKSSVIAVCARGSDAHEGESEEILGEINESPAMGGDETQGRKTRIRLTAEVAGLVGMSEYIRGALPAIAGGCARATLSAVLPEEPALPAPPAPPAAPGLAAPVPAGYPALPGPGSRGGGEEGPPALPAAAPQRQRQRPESEAEKALAAPPNDAMALILSAAVEPCAGLREEGDGGAEAADAAVGLALDSTGAAFLNATVGTEVGARAEEAGQDGSPNGVTWIWVFQNGRKTAFRTALTRSSIVPERHIGRFRGKFVADGYAAYPKVLEGNEIQSCWAHRIRGNWADALHPDATPEAAELAGEIDAVFHMAKEMLESGVPRSRSLRTVLESEISDVLDRHKGSDDPVAAGMVKRTLKSMPNLFPFAEHEGVEPTNNRSERPLRRPVVFRKSSTQCKGGRRSMERSDHLSTCTDSWRSEGKSVFKEIRRTILAHGTPWERGRFGPRGPIRPPGPGPPPPPAASAAHAGQGEAADAADAADAAGGRARRAGRTRPAASSPAA